MNDDQKSSYASMAALIMGTGENKKKVSPEERLARTTPEPDYYLSMLTGLFQIYRSGSSHAHGTGDHQKGAWFQAKADAVAECMQHYEELCL